MSRKRATARINREDPTPQAPLHAPTPRAVLQELFDLLEEYAPAWYTEELHNRAQAALLSKDRNRP
ncbi:hypothetical protein DYQ86_03345 [Acidobacteria bacterium AB60]|nr:hypothetical protein DYQ86_03345 [Acidobacteria bacterium AB60]